MALLLVVAAVGAEMIGTIVGFGSSTVFLPLALLLVDFPTALILTAFLHLFGNLGRIGFFRHGLDPRLLLRFGLPSVASTILGALLVSHTTQDTLKASLGGFLVVYAALSLWRDDLHVAASTTNAVIGGSLSGFLAGLIGTGGALRGAFLTAYGLRKETYVATAAAIALAVDLTRIPLYPQQGLLTAPYRPYIPLLLLAALVGSWSGRKIVGRIPQRRFRRIVLVALFLIGIKFLFDGLR